MSTVDTYTVNCPVTTTTTTTISPTVYAYSVQLDNSTATICAASIVTVYSTSVILTTGDTIYYDSGLTTLVTGYDYVVDAAGNPSIYDLNSGTGVIGADTMLDC
jgi:predicted choloylglycine hydrolase